jgi:antitoxin CptB
VIATDLARLAWRCRRGMLELDWLLQGFLEGGHYQKLSPQDQAVFVDLLECTDAVLLEYLLGRMTPADPALANVVREIRRAAAP